MPNDSETRNELQQGQVGNDMGLSAEEQNELIILEILLALDSIKKDINGLKRASLEILPALDSIKEAINGINGLKRASLEILPALDSIKEAINGINLTDELKSTAKAIEEMASAFAKAIQEIASAKKQELERETNTKTTTPSLSEIFREKIRPQTPPHVLIVIEEELAKLLLLQPSSNEFNVTRNYLDWLIALPWGIYSDENFNVLRAGQILNEQHYGLAVVKETILEHLAFGMKSGTFQGRIICLSGPPGVGKTSIASSIARALNREFDKLSVGGLSDVSEIKGHRRTYTGAMPGKMVKCLKNVGTSNPLVLIDEIDKLGRGHFGDPASAMLELLDPVQNAKFLDHYVDVPIDLSKVLFVCTANVVDNIPKPLLDRMEVIDIAGYTTDEKVSIARDYLEKDIRKLCKIKPEEAEVTDAALLVLIEDYCREAGVRNLQNQLKKIYSKITLQLIQPSEEADAVPTDLPADQFSDSKDLPHTNTIQESEATKTIEKIVVDTSNLADFVGKPVFQAERIYDRTPVGVVMGLAWTANGGTVLYVETAATEEAEGKGDLLITGQLGDVMKESAQIAYAVARSVLLKKDPDSHYFANTKLHLHVPAGATPKDGPSAGCAMITSILSLAMGKLVKEDLAITGEVTLMGKILPIGGVMAKTTAARRNGVKTIIFPLANKREFDELAPNVKEGLDVHFVDDYSQILEIVFRDD